MSNQNLRFKDVADRLALDAERVLRHLLPNGKRHFNELCAGSINGEPGESLKVCLGKGKKGIWCDFATGKGGDLLELWRQVHGLTPREAITQAKEWLGITEIAFSIKRLKPPISFEKPKGTQNLALAGSKVAKYLTEERGLSIDTLKQYKIGESVKNGKPAIEFPYIREDSLIMIKTLCLERPNGKKQIFVTPNAEPSLFGWQAIPNDARRIVLTEGEIDAMTLHQYGIKIFNSDSKQQEAIGVLSVPFGGGGGEKQKWIEYEYDRLSMFDEIYLCLDADQEGQSAVDLLIERLGSHRCRIVALPFKDANECLKQGISGKEIQECFKNAKAIDPVELVLPSKYKQQVIDRLCNKLTENPQTLGYQLPWESARGKICFRPSELSIWTGINGHGKSQLLGFVALDCIRQGAKVLIASMEMKADLLLDRLSRQAAGVKDPTEQYVERIVNWFDEGLMLFDRIGNVDIDRLLEVFKYARCRYDVDVFIVDSLMKFGIEEDDYNGQKAFVEKLCNFKHDYNCHVHLVAHSRKVDHEYTPPGKMDVKGSGAITDLTDNCFTVWRNKQKEKAIQDGNSDEQEKEKPDSLLYCHKQRNGGWEGAIPLWFKPDSFQYLGWPNERERQMVDYSNGDFKQELK